MKNSNRVDGYVKERCSQIATGLEKLMPKHGLSLTITCLSLVLLSAASAAFAETWVHVNNATIRMALNDRKVVFTNEGNQQIGGRQSWTGDGTTVTASDRVGIWIARNREYCSKRADKGQPLPANWDCFEFAISQDGKKMRFGSGDYTWVGEFIK